MARPDSGIVAGKRRRSSRIDRVIGRAQSLADLGDEIAPGLHRAELDYLCREEWARAADDVLWRRSKLGLHFSADERARVAALFGGAQEQRQQREVA